MTNDCFQNAVIITALLSLVGVKGRNLLKNKNKKKEEEEDELKDIKVVKKPSEAKRKTKKTECKTFKIHKKKGKTKA